MHDHPVEVGFVGKSKVRLGSHAFGTHSWGGGVMPLQNSALPPPLKGSKGMTKVSSTEQLFFQLKEFEEFREPSFNVLYVQTPRPAFVNSPLLAALAMTLKETGEMLQPVLRLGIPENSLRNKLPYFREDMSHLPNNVRPRVQKLLKANVQYAQEQAALSVQAAEEWRQMKKARKAAKKAGNKPLPVPQQLQQLQETFSKGSGGGEGHSHGHGHIPPPHFYTHEMPTWMVPALNLAAYWYLCGMNGIWKGGM